MRPDEIKNEIIKLDISEQIMLLEDIWDSIAQNNSTLPLSSWQKQELESRYKSFKNGELKLNDWKDVHSRIRNTQK